MHSVVEDKIVQQLPISAYVMAILPNGLSHSPDLCQTAFLRLIKMARNNKHPISFLIDSQFVVVSGLILTLTKARRCGTVWFIVDHSVNYGDIIALSNALI